MAPQGGRLVAATLHHAAVALALFVVRQHLAGIRG